MAAKKSPKRRAGSKRKRTTRKSTRSAHKPIKLLKTFRSKMQKNIIKLDKLIKKRGG